MKKITVLNAYGDKNIGDAAILKVALDFISEAYGKNFKISVLCENTKSFSSFITEAKNITPFQLPYGYAIDGTERVSSLKKVFRFIDIYMTSFNLVIMNKIFRVKLPETGFYSYIKEIKDANNVVSMGGCYLTSTRTSDYFGLLLTLLPIYVAKFYRKNITFLPMTIGPFANDNHSRLAINGITNTTIIARDHITLNLLEKFASSNNLNLSFAPDLALFFKNDYKSVRTIKDKYIVLTAREWFSDPKKQEKYETSLIKLVEYVWKAYKLKTVFIPMARNEIEDDDNRVAERIMQSLPNKDIFSIYHPESISDVREKLSKATISVCTRMHSAILSATVNTPFIAIGYGHKTLGFARDFDLEKWHIDIGDVNFNGLKKLFDNLTKKENYQNFIEKVEARQRKNKIYKSKIINTLSMKLL